MEYFVNKNLTQHKPKGFKEIKYNYFIYIYIKLWYWHNNSVKEAPITSRMKIFRFDFVPGAASTPT